MAYRECTAADRINSLGMTNVCNEDENLGLSLKPPKWLRNIVSGAVKGTTVTVPTPIGPQTIRVDDPNAMKQIRQAYTPNITFGPPREQQAIQQAATFGGGGLLLGAGAVLLVVLLMRRK